MILAQGSQPLLGEFLFEDAAIGNAGNSILRCASAQHVGETLESQVGDQQAQIEELRQMIKALQESK